MISRLIIYYCDPSIDLGSVHILRQQDFPDFEGRGVPDIALSAFRQHRPRVGAGHFPLVLQQKHSFSFRTQIFVSILSASLKGGGVPDMLT